MKTNDIVKIVLVVIIIGVGGYFFYKNLLSPKIVEIKDINDQIVTKKTELETYNQVRKFKSQLVDQNTYYKDWVSKIYFIIPNKFTNSDNARLILNLTQLGVSSGVNIAKISISDPSISTIAGTSKNTPKRISKNIISLSISLDTSNYSNFKKFNDMLLNNFENIIIPESYVGTSSVTKVPKSADVVIYSETINGYLVLSPDATMPEKAKK